MLAESRFLGQVVLSNFKRLKHPYKLSFAITYRCNFKCNMCNIWQKPKVQELTTQEIETFFQGTNDFSWVGLTGGEIFLRKDLLDIVKIVHQYCRGLSVLHFPTAGYLTERIISDVEGMLRTGLKKIYVTISLDGPKEIHEKVRGIPGSWAKAMATFKILKAMPGVYPYISMTFSKGNLGSIDQTIKEIKEVYPVFDPNKMMNFNSFQRSTHYYANENIESPDDKLLLQDIDQALDIVGKGPRVKNYLQRNYLMRYGEYLKTGKSPLPCQALSASCFIDPYGEVFPCSVYDKSIGNIKDPSFNFLQRWNSSESAALHQACKKGDCPGCWSPCDAYQSINGNLLKL